MGYKILDKKEICPNQFEIKVDEGALADFGMDTVVEGNGPLDEHTRFQIAHQIPQNRLPGFGLVFIEPVIILIELVGFALQGFQLRVQGLKKLSRENSFLFCCHG